MRHLSVLLLALMLVWVAVTSANLPFDPNHESWHFPSLRRKYRAYLGASPHEALARPEEKTRMKVMVREES